MNTHEIVTLQIGHYSNCIGTHLWNIQESNFVYADSEKDLSGINHDVLFREGLNSHGDVTYTPRLVCVDLKGSLNCLKLDGDLYSTAQTDAQIFWSGEITEIRQEPAKKNDFQNDLDNTNLEKENDDPGDKSNLRKDNKPSTTVEKNYNLDTDANVWSDYRRFGLHPKSLTIVNDYQHENPSSPFAHYAQGVEVYKSNYSLRCELEDQLHKFVEECDYLQGVHILYDCYDGFAGLACSVIEELTDDLANRSILTFPCSPQRPLVQEAGEKSTRCLNTAFSLANTSCYSNIAVVPLTAEYPATCDLQPCIPTFQHIDYNHYQAYHSAALHSLCLNTLTLPYRLSDSSKANSHLSNILEPLITYNRPVLAMKACLPFPKLGVNGCHGDGFGTPLYDDLDAAGDTGLPWQRMSYGVGVARRPPSAQSIVLSAEYELDQRSDNEDSLKQFTQQLCPNTFSSTHYNPSSCRLRAPFPKHIFSGLDRDGRVIDKRNISIVTENPEHIPVATCIEQSPSTFDFLATLARPQRLQELAVRGVERDTLRQMQNDLLTHAEVYSDS